MVLIDGELDVGEDFVLTNVILARRGGGMFDLQVSCIQIDTVQCTQAALDDGKDTIQSCHVFFFCTLSFNMNCVCGDRNIGVSFVSH